MDDKVSEALNKIISNISLDHLIISHKYKVSSKYL